MWVHFARPVNLVDLPVVFFWEKVPSMKKSSDNTGFFCYYYVTVGTKAVEFIFQQPFGWKFQLIMPDRRPWFVLFRYVLLELLQNKPHSKGGVI